MTEEIVPREDRMGKILAFLGGCIAGIVGVFAVAVMSEMTPCTESSDDSGACCEEQDEILTLSDSNSSLVD